MMKEDRSDPVLAWTIIGASVVTLTLLSKWSWDEKLAMVGAWLIIWIAWRTSR